MFARTINYVMEDRMKTVRIRKQVLAAGFAASLFSLPAASVPVISELFYDATGSDAGKVFVELFGSPGDSLNGLVLEGINGGTGSVYSSVALSGVIPADGVFVIGDDNGGTTSVLNADMIASIDYQNGPDSVVLRGLSGIIDAIGYGSFGVGDVFAGEGTPAPDAPGGSSLERFDPFVDSDDNGTDFWVLNTPSPGTVPGVSSVPLPASAWLMGSGLLGVASLARRR